MALDFPNTPADGDIFTSGVQSWKYVAAQTNWISYNTSFFLLSINAQVGTTYTAVLADQYKMIEMNNAAANIFYIPTDASVAFPIGTQMTILQTGAGKTQILAVTPGTTTINGTPGFYLRAQWSSATIIKRAANSWVLVGDTSST